MTGLPSPTTARPDEEAGDATKPILAYIVLAHFDPEHFGRLIRRLADPRVASVVHVDDTSPLAPFRHAAAPIPNVTFIEKRVRARHFRELANRNTWKRRPLFVLKMLLRVGPKRLPDSPTFAAGSNWIALMRDCAQHRVTLADENRTFNPLFKTVFATYEVFDTLVENSRFAGDAGPIERYSDVTGVGGPWRYGNLHVLDVIAPILTTEKAETILSEHPVRLSARKFGTSTAAEAPAVIDQQALSDREAAMLAPGTQARHTRTMPYRIGRFGSLAGSHSS